MEHQDVIDLPFPDSFGFRDKTVGQVVQNLQSAISRKDRQLSDLRGALRQAQRERDEALGSLESRKNEIDSFKVLDMLTRSQLISKLQISEESELGRELSQALTSALQGLSRQPRVLELED